MNGFFEKGTPIHKDTKASFYLLFGNLLMFIPPVGRYSVECFSIMSFMYLLTRKQNVFGFLSVCVKKLLEIIFGINSLTEIVSFKTTRRVVEKNNGSLFSSQFNVRTSVYHLYRL